MNSRSLKHACCMVSIAIAASIAAVTMNAARADEGEARLATVKQLTASQNATLMYVVRTKEAEARAQYEQRIGGAAQTDDSGVPVVTGIFGSNGKQYARILFPDGVTADAYEGRTVRGGYKVVTVNLEKVELSKGGKVIELGTSDSAPAAPRPSQTPTMAGNPQMGTPMAMPPR